MNQEEIYKYITMNIVMLENLIMCIDNKKNKYKIKREIDVLKNQSKKLRMLIFKGELNEKLDLFDEWSNVALELMQESYVCGFERSLAIIKAYNNGEIKEEK